MPVQYTKVTEGKHQYSVNSLNIATINSTKVLISSSFEGKICQWSIKDLRFI